LTRHLHICGRTVPSVKTYHARDVLINIGNLAAALTDAARDIARRRGLEASTAPARVHWTAATTQIFAEIVIPCVDTTVPNTHVNEAASSAWLGRRVS
jgi:hypothetical protein